MMQAEGDNAGAPEGMKLPPVVARIANQTPGNKAPICVLMVGMAGSGKTTLLAQLQQSTMPNETETEGDDDDEEQEESVAAAPSQTETQNDGDEENENEDKKPPTSAAAAASPPTGERAKMPAYCVNLDPATINVPYNASIDIRDTVDYKVRSSSSSRGRQRKQNKKRNSCTRSFSSLFFFLLVCLFVCCLCSPLPLTASYATTQFGSQWSDHDIFEFVCH